MLQGLSSLVFHSWDQHKEPFMGLEGWALQTEKKKKKTVMYSNIILFLVLLIHGNAKNFPNI